MSRLSLAFFSAAVICAITGMVWGAVMGSSQDFTLAPAHAHLNLVGWASLAIMGTFYALTGKGGRIGWINFALSTTGVVIMVPFIALKLSGSNAAELGIIIGSTIAILGMLTFLAVVLSAWGEAKTV